MSTKLIAADASAGVILDPSSGDGTLVIQTGTAGMKVDAITIAADGTPTFLKVPKNTTLQSMVVVNTPNGRGSINTCVQNFATSQVSQGSDITWTASATLGSIFTINTSGVYACDLTCVHPNANGHVGISVNATGELSTNIENITAAKRLTMSQAYAPTARVTCSRTSYFTTGDVVRVHTDSATMGTAAAVFSITRIA